MSDHEKIRKSKKEKKRHLENEKEKFRKSKEWKDFRAKMAVMFNHRDYITGKRLIKGFNLHHLKTEQTSDTYKDISNPDEFIPLNSYCHKLLHYLFTYYRKDPTIINRLVEILDRMCELVDDDAEIEDNNDYGEGGDLFVAGFDEDDGKEKDLVVEENMQNQNSEQVEPELVCQKGQG